MTIPQPL